MAVQELAADTISAEIPYLRSELELLHVEFTKRNLGDDVLDRRMLQVRDGRHGLPPSLDREGFVLVDWPSRTVRNDAAALKTDITLLKESAVEKAYCDDTVPLIQALSGAREVYPLLASTVRFSPAAMEATKMTPAGWAHLDYDPAEAELQLKETLERHGVTPKPYGRFILYQGWRVLSDPPQDYPLAICDGRTVAPEDIIPIEYHLRSQGHNVTYRSRGSRYNEAHRWWYFSDMTPDEMIVFKGFDSSCADTFKTLHVAFENKSVERPVPRISIETRYFALFD